MSREDLLVQSPSNTHIAKRSYKGVTHPAQTSGNHCLEDNHVANLCVQAFKRAKEVADSELAQHKSPPKLASEEEVRRVLAAKTDYDCLQVSCRFDGSV